jgi:2Fe-2S ferredoxin
VKRGKAAWEEQDMVEVTFVTHKGEKRTVEGQEGDSVMQVALNNGVAGILADCGGALSCATCHVHIAPDWIEKVGQPGAEEETMLEMAVDPDETSRLSCQISLSSALDGLVINLPASQL